MAAWHRSMIREPVLSIEINISFKQLAEAGLAEDVESILAETAVDSRYCGRSTWPATPFARPTQIVSWSNSRPWE